MDKLLQELKELENPLTQTPLERENREVRLTQDGKNYRLTYVRDGINLETKKKIENSFYQIFENHGISEDHVFIMSKGREKSLGEKNQKEKTQTTASLKTGHGPTPKAKKRVEGAKKVVAIASGKGGVGKSTVAVNLAYAFIQKGKKVGLIDADIYGPSIPMMLGKRKERPRGEGKKIVPTTSGNLSFVSFGQFVDEKDPVIWRGPMLGGVLNQFLFDVQWKDLDILLIDLPPGTGDMPLSMVQLTEIDGVIIVTTPGEVALMDSVKGLKMFQEVHVNIVGLVENMSFFICNKCNEKHYLFGRGGGERVSKELSINFLGEIALEEKLRDAGDQGRPYMDESMFKGNATWKSYMAIANNADKIIFRNQGFFKKLFTSC